MRPTRPLVPLLIALSLSGCTTVAPQAPGPEEGFQPSPGLLWVRTAAEYEAAFRQTYRLAVRRLEQIAADREPGTWAVALDADETVISNSLYQKELEAAGLSHSAERWQAWVERHEAPPLPGTTVFLERIHELGGKIAIVTNRDEVLCPDTRANFDAFGIPYDIILCQPPDEPRKEGRWDRLARGTAAPDLPPLEILMWIGDNIHDFPNLDQGLRDQGAEAFRLFGTVYFALPNPLYGSWTDNPPQ